MLLFRPRSKTRYILSVERTHCTMTIARSCIVLRLLHSRLHPPKEYGERHSSDAIGAESPSKGSNCGWSLLLAQLAKEYPSRRTLRDRASQWTTPVVKQSAECVLIAPTTHGSAARYRMRACPSLAQYIVHHIRRLPLDSQLESCIRTSSLPRQ